MTIAMAYVSPEGVVLGADSTASMTMPSAAGQSGFHYFSHNQKVFEIGEQSTYGLTMWGLGGLGGMSYRTLIARLADSFSGPAGAPANVLDVVTRWINTLTPEYTAFLGTQARYQALRAKTPFVPGAAVVDPNARTQDEDKEYANLLLNLGVGFYIGGYHPADRKPEAYRIWFDPNTLAPIPQAVTLYDAAGAPNVVARLIWGLDLELKAKILGSQHWHGQPADLDQLVAQSVLLHPVLPIRDAIDFVHMCILSTIKAMKFSSLAQICGGPIELAVITSDRKFRWVRHKHWDAAISEGDHAWTKHA